MLRKRLMEYGFSGRHLWCVVGPALAALLLSACSTAKNAPGRIGTFSEVTSLAAINVAAAFEVVERNYYQTQANALAVNYDTEGFNPADIKHFLTPEEITARTAVLDGLKVYARKLSEIMGNEQLDRFDAQTQAFGQALVDLNKNKALGKKPFSESELQAFATAVNAIGRWFIEYKREKTVKQIVQEMKPHVHEVCLRLREDIGVVDGQNSRKGPGLRNQLWNQYEKMMRDQNQWISRNKTQMDARTRREEIARLPALVREREEADSALEATQKTLSTLAMTHDKLDEAFSENSPELDVLIRQLAAEAERVKKFYENLSKK